MNNAKHKETDLYEPVKRLLTSQGFIVRGEVKGCDVTALKDDMLWVVELKLSFNMTLLYQAMERQALTGWVFVAVPRPLRANDGKYRLMQRVLKKMELGLITVSLDSAVPMAEVVLFPGGKANKTNKAAKAVRKEISGRTMDTAGGANKTAVNTAFRERCVRIACLLEAKGPLSGTELIKKYNCGKDANRIMYINTYGWYERVGKGLYGLSPAGYAYLNENADNSLIAYYRMKSVE
jgi:hypothetical protein